METSLSALGILVELLERLGISIGKYQKKKKVEEQLFNALSDEIEAFASTFERMTTLGTARLLPSLGEIADAPYTVSEMNNIIECVAELFLLYADLLRSFIDIANGCYEISSYEGFMRDLDQSDRLLHDLVLCMKNIRIAPNRIRIDSSFYRFTKLYEHEILEDVRANDVSKVVQEMEPYVKILKKIKPSLTRSVTKRSRRRLRESLNRLARVGRRVKISKDLSRNLRDYLPPKFLPIMILIEEMESIE